VEVDTRNRTLRVAASVVAMAAVIAVWATLPLGPQGLQVVDLELGALYVMALWSIVPFSLIMAGWHPHKNSVEAGAVHAVSHSIAYRIPQLLALLVVVMLSGSLSFQGIVLAQSVPHIVSVPLAALIFFLAGSAQVAALPLGLTATSPRRADGRDTHSGAWLSALSIAGVVDSFTVCVVFSLLFLGGWRGPWVTQAPLLGVLWLLLKAGLVHGARALLRAATPHLRIDQLLASNWGAMVPLALVLLMAVGLVEKALVTAGVTLMWRSAGLLATNALIALVAVALRSQMARAQQARGPARVPEGR
jgi:NADH-quinone oxidoreductase subunit H